MSQKQFPDIQYIKGVGPKRAKLLARLDIENVRDLLFYFPREYEDRREVKKISSLKPGIEATLRAKVIKKETKKVRKGLKLLRVTFSDESDVVNGIWFNQNFLKDKFQPGKYFYLYGSLNEDSLKYNKKEINNPLFEEDCSNPLHLKRIVPLYSLTSGLTQKQMRVIIFNVINNHISHLTDILPEHIKNKYRFCSLTEGLRGLHFPQGKNDYISAKQRMAFEELFILQLQVLKRKRGLVEKTGIKHDKKQEKIDFFLNSLSFELTGAQHSAWRDIEADMEQETPMQRLLQGDVGSGKTVVATMALLKTVESGYQGLFMAPTEILAEQHYFRLKEKLAEFNLNICLLIGSLASGEKKKLVKKIADNKVDLIIGTHALFQEQISYSNIGLVVIDEQHRFGVEQRSKLKEKGNNPDLLVMTATPIPRSLALTLYGDMDLSLIDEMPPGRKPVKTSWRRKSSRGSVYQFVRENLNEGRQAFVVCPLIEPSEEISAISAQETRRELENRLLAGFKVEMMHGKIESGRKKEIMEKFHRGEIQVLVSTTVIEVGIDVPNATIMVIEDGQRFGLAQLHQLRGRVGRGEHQSYCIVVADPTTDDANRRLEVFTSTNDGFKIAEEDLKIRGPGEFFGTEQHGITDLKVASLVKNQQLLSRARQEAEKILNQKKCQSRYPDLFKFLEKQEVKL